jgi:peptidoglycan/LPS O-acetylase OafA/YrhL
MITQRLAAQPPGPDVSEFLAHYIAPWLFAVVLVTTAALCVVMYFQTRSNQNPDPRWLALGGGALVAGLVSGTFGYLAMDAAVRPYGLTAALVLLGLTAVTTFAMLR